MRDVVRSRRGGFAVLAAAAGLVVGTACPQGEPGGLRPRVPEGERPATLGEEGPLSVTFGSPRGSTWTPTEIAVGFSKSMVPLDRAGTADTTALFHISPAVDGEYRWLGSQVLTFVPARPLPLSSEFKVTVPAGVKALDGSELAEEYSYLFDTPRVRVARNDPYSGERWRKPQSPVDLWFNQPVDPEVLARHASFSAVPRAGGAEVRVGARARLGRERGRAEPHEGVEPAEDEGELEPRHLVVEPVSPLPLGADVTLSIDEDLKGTEGNLPMGEPWSLFYETYGDFLLETASCYSTPYGGCSPTGGFHLEFSNPVKWRDAVAHIRITPAIELPAEPLWAEVDQSATIYVGVELQPDTTYSVEVDAELRDVFGQTLSGNRQGSFKVGSYAPLADLDFSGTVLEGDGPHTLPARFRNVDSAKLVLRQYSLDELLRWRFVSRGSLLGGVGGDLAGMAGSVIKTIRPGTAPNTERTMPLDLDPAFRGAKRGFVAVQLIRPVVPGEYTTGIDSSFVRVSDLGLTAKVSPRGLAVWVTSLRTARPVAGATVKLYRSANAPLFEGRSGADGLVFIPEDAAGSGSDYYPDTFLVYAKKGPDENYLVTDGYWGLDPWSFGVPYGWQQAKERIVGRVFTDRGIYRPGDTVHLKGVARTLTDDGMATPAGKEVSLTIWDSRGEAVPLELPDDFRLGPFGGFDVDVALPADAPLGSFQINARVGPSADTARGEQSYLYGSFRVAEYKAPTFQVKVTADKEEYVRGDTLSFRVDGRYLFGAPMAAADVRWWVTRSETSFRPKNEDWEGYWFGEEWNWWEEPDQAPTSGMVAEGTARLAADGSLAGTAPLEFAELRRPASVTVEGQVSDLDRSSIAGRRSVVVHPGRFYLGAKKLSEGLLRAGEELAVGVVALTPDEQVRSGISVHGTLFRREWHTVRQEGMGGHYDYVTRPENEEVGRCEAVTTSAPVRCAVRIPEAGEYVLRLEATDESGNPIRTDYETWASGAGAASWYRSDDNRMELVADKEEYRPGDTAKILVQSPFPESEALLTVEREGLLVRKSFHVTSNAPVIEVPILDTYRPNVFVSVLLVRGRVRDTTDERGDDPGKPAYAMGMVQLDVETGSKRLTVDVRPDREEHGPGEEIRVDLVVRGADGTGLPAEVTLFAVDEAVLQLTGYEPPDLMAAFWGERGVSVRTAEIRQTIISRRSYDEDKGAAGGGGGGGGGGGALRTDFRTVAYWNPAVLTDAEGKASLSFRLPENLTTYRIMAVATTQTDRFGDGKAEVRIAKPLLLRAALPRFVRTDDRFEAGVVVTNRGGPAGDAVVTVEADGLRLDGDASRTVRLEAGRSAEVRFPFVSGAPGTARFRFRVSMGELGDGLETTREVKLPMIPETVATYGETLARALEGVGDLDLIRPDVGGLTVAVSSSALTGLQPAMEYLWWYPYECTEQLVSRIVPVVALRELCDGLGLTLPPNAEKIVSDALGRIPERQRNDGGFGYWSDSWRSDPWLTAYVVWGLRRAQERDVKIPETVLARAMDYLSDQLRRSDSSDVWLGLATKAFIVYVLADAGEPEHGFQEALFDRYDELPLIARGWLALAYILSDDACAAGDCVPIVELRRDLENHVFQTAEEAHFEENVGDLYRVLMQSNTTLNAILLDVILTMDVNHPLATKLTRWLLEERDGGHWATTQDSAWALLAFAHFYRVREAEDPDFTATIDFGSERILSQRFEGRPAKEYREEIPMSRLMGGRGDRLAIERQGAAGRLYYALSLHYARSDLPRDGIDRGFYLERHYEVVDMAAMRDGAGITRPAPSVTRVRAGDMVRVQVTIAVPQERTMVVVEDPLPAGLESVDFDLRTTALSLLRATSGYSVGDNDPYGGYSLDDGPPDDGDYGYGYYGYGYEMDYSDEWWWTPFYHREDRDDRVLLFADELPAGVHHYEYLAQAVTPGTFVVGPLRAEEMYNPETFGRTGVLEFVVDPPAE